MRDEILLALLALIPLGFAFWGQRAWRMGHRKALLACLFGAIAAGLGCWLVVSLRWDDGPAMMINVLMLVGNLFLLGPAFGLLVGLITGLVRGPKPAQGAKS